MENIDDTLNLPLVEAEPDVAEKPKKPSFLKRTLVRVAVSKAAAAATTYLAEKIFDSDVDVDDISDNYVDDDINCHDDALAVEGLENSDDQDIQISEDYCG